MIVISALTILIQHLSLQHSNTFITLSLPHSLLPHPLPHSAARHLTAPVHLPEITLTAQHAPSTDPPPTATHGQVPSRPHQPRR
jgi:hypothetical protein